MEARWGLWRPGARQMWEGNRNGYSDFPFPSLRRGQILHLVLVLLSPWSASLVSDRYKKLPESPQTLSPLTQNVSYFTGSDLGPFGHMVMSRDRWREQKLGHQTSSGEQNLRKRGHLRERGWYFEGRSVRLSLCKVRWCHAARHTRAVSMGGENRKEKT